MDWYAVASIGSYPQPGLTSSAARAAYAASYGLLEPIGEGRGADRGLLGIGIAITLT